MATTTDILSPESCTLVLMGMQQGVAPVCTGAPIEQGVRKESCLEIALCSVMLFNQSSLRMLLKNFLPCASLAQFNLLCSVQSKYLHLL
jgi:hypothetical protein